MTRLIFPTLSSSRKSFRRAASRTAKAGGACIVVALAFGTAACGDAASDESADEASAMLVVFEDAYSDTGRLIVVADADGRLAVKVHGMIGRDDHIVGGQAMNQPTLAETYRVLHPDALELPSRVLALSEELEAQRAELPTEAETSDVAAVQDKDFWSQACITFAEGFTFRWIPRYCDLQNTNATMRTNYTVGPQDRNFVWNESANQPTLRLQRITGTFYSAVHTQPPWSWGWYDWAVTTTTNRAALAPGHTTSKMGLTWHDFDPIVL
jgi:hypothetical protein